MAFLRTGSRALVAGPDLPAHIMRAAEADNLPGDDCHVSTPARGSLSACLSWPAGDLRRQPARGHFCSHFEIFS